MKKAILLLTLSAACLSSWSAPVSQQQARALAADFMARKGITTLESQPRKAPQFSTGAEVAAPAYYVFNASAGEGYVIVSGDDRTAPVLGYADQGTFDADHLPEGLAWLLQSYEEQLSRLDKTTPAASTTATAAARMKTPGETARRSLEPLLQSLWNQGSPYNLLCPRYYNEDGTEGNLSATGCVATAIAQVMGYYRYPEKTVRSIPGYIQTYDTSEGTKSVRLNTIQRGSEIKWDQILPIYDGTSTAEQDTAIAELMYWVGMGCKMGYGSQSGAGFSEGINALINYFGYDDGTHIAYRGQYTIQGWADLLYSEIATGHPIAFAGTNTGGAHAFVLDGYDIDGLFHLNWGWGGMNNGYFRIDVLAPDDQSGIGASLTPDGYNMGQEAIILRLPDDERNAKQYVLNANDWEIRDGGRRFFTNFVNWSGVSSQWDMGLAEVLTDGTLEPLSTSLGVQLGTNTFVGREFVISGLSQGLHRLVPVSKRSSTKEWLTQQSRFVYYILTEIDANGQVVQTTQHPIEDIVVDTIAFPGSLKVGDDQPVCATFSNRADEYFHEIHLFASLTDDKGKSFCRTAVTMTEGGQTTTTFTFKPTAAGTWNVWLATDDSGRNIVGQATVEISAEGVQRTSNLRYVTHTVTNRSNGVVYGTRMQGKVTVMNQHTSEPYDGTLRLWLFKLNTSNGMYYGANSVYHDVHIDPRRTTQVDYYFDNLEMGAQYVMSILYVEGGDIQDGGLRQMGTTGVGVVYWQQNQTMRGQAVSNVITTPSAAVAIDLTGLSGRYQDVRPNTNPNTLYILDSGAEVPQGLLGRNVVRGAQADSICLTDGFSFFSPQRFSAARAVYRRQLVPQVQWETIALPFAVSQLPQGIEVRSFDRQDDAGQVCFSPVGSMLANVPYVLSAAASQSPRYDAEGALIPDSLCLTAADVQFSSTSEAPMVVGTSDYRFVGTTTTTGISAGYVLNGAGTAFEPVAALTQVAPFRACFSSLTEAGQSAGQILIGTPQVLGIEAVSVAADGWRSSAAAADGWRDLSGRRIASPQHPGVYINNGRKVVVAP